MKTILNNALQNSKNVVSFITVIFLVIYLSLSVLSSIKSDINSYIDYVSKYKQSGIYVYTGIIEILVKNSNQEIIDSMFFKNLKTLEVVAIKDMYSNGKILRIVVVKPKK